MNKGLTLAINLVLTVGACTGADQARQPSGVDAPPIGQSACFYGRQVQGFRVLDRSSLIVFAPTQRHAYRVEISPPTAELRFVDTIGFESSSSQVCGRAGDRLLLGTSSIHRYPVIDVQRLTAAQLEAHGPDGEASGLEPEPGIEADIEPLENAGDQ